MRSTTSVNRFFYNATPTTEIYSLSLHDALPILGRRSRPELRGQEHPLPAGGTGSRIRGAVAPAGRGCSCPDRKSTRLNSSHVSSSYAVFCLKKKKTHPPPASSDDPERIKTCARS